MKIGMSDQRDVAEIPCKFRCDPMSGRGGAGERSEPPLPFSLIFRVFFAYLLPFPGVASKHSEPLYHFSSKSQVFLLKLFRHITPLSPLQVLFF